MLISIVIAQSHTNIFISSNTTFAVVELKMSSPACRTSSYRLKNQLYKLIRVKDLDQFANVGGRGERSPNNDLQNCKLGKRIIVLFRCGACLFAYQWLLGRYTGKAARILSKFVCFLAFTVLLNLHIFRLIGGKNNMTILRLLFFVHYHTVEIIECELELEWLNLSHCPGFFFL